MEYHSLILGTTETCISKAADLLKRGEVVAIPTETVYGLAANALDEKAVEKIFKAKGRPQDNPLIVHVSNVDMISYLVTEIPALAKKCADKFWPGPLTMVLPKSDKIPMVTSAGLDTVGIRMPSDKTARAIIEKCGLPLAAPSANRSGSPSPTSADHVFDDMNGRISCIIDGGFSSVGVESTVISFEGDSIRLLRPGFISVSDLKEITPKVLIDKGVLDVVEDDEKVSSPGMKYKHYSPNADIIIIDGELRNYRDYVSKNNDNETWCMVFEKSDIEGLNVNYLVYGDDDEKQAQLLFDTLREFDKHEVKKVFARCPSKTGVGLAVYNRLLRAAAFQVVKV